MAERPTYSSYIAEANLAVRYTQEKIRIGPADSVLSIIRKGPIMGPVDHFRAWSGIDKMYAAVDKDMAAYSKANPNTVRPGSGQAAGPEEWRAYIESMARRASEFGIGNCGEHAAVAFKFLEDRGTRPLDYIVMTNGDHAMVLLGSTVPVKQNNFKEWSVESVYCDPWGGAAWLGSQLAVHYPNKKFCSVLHVA